MKITVKRCLLVVGWLLCSLYYAGTTLAFFQGEFPSLAGRFYRQDLATSIGIGLAGGPIAATVAFFCSGFNEHGWRLTPVNHK